MTHVISDNERTVLHAVMRQAESDLRLAHAEICKLQGLDPGQKRLAGMVATGEHAPLVHSDPREVRHTDLLSSLRKGRIDGYPRADDRRRSGGFPRARKIGGPVGAARTRSVLFRPIHRRDAGYKVASPISRRSRSRQGSLAGSNSCAQNLISELVA